ncbi:MAG: aminopeptidase P family N-terminal domain-containing protein, partial [Muribaculaceae bacterium]|nr:aminopeptidase P family N-terminal domain-containing protein [Muribaculaceae bacterium]
MKEQITQRLSLLRDQMRQAGIAATVIPQTDPHQSEYLADHWQVRRWLTGFTGSAGTLVVTPAEALLWTDSRYFIQAAQQLEDTPVTLMKDGLPDTPSITSYLIRNLVKGSVVGIDGALFSINEADTLRESLSRHSLTLNTKFNPVDTIWTDRPSLPDAKVFIHDVKYAGQSAADKISRILADAATQGASSMLISALDEIAWTLNIRSCDVPCNPVATSFLYLSPTGSTLFINEEKIDATVRNYLTQAGVSVAPYNTVLTFLSALPAESRVLIEAIRTSSQAFDTLGNRAVVGASPVPMLKAVKNSTQINGIRTSMEHDGAALVAAFMEIERMMQSGEELTELKISEILTRFRSQQPHYFDESFETIAGYGPHGAIVHYSATPQSSSTIEPHGLLLIDSGAQYLTGTPDITRTIAMGTPTDLEKHDFT